VVRADWRNPSRLQREGWHRTWFNFGGINREVSLRPLANSDISAPFVRTRLRPGGSALVDVAMHVRNRAGARTLAAMGALVHDGKRYEFTFPKRAFGARETKVLTTRVVVPDAALWSPTTPNLYDVELAVGDETRYDLRTGLRELGRRGTTLLLNGKPIELRGASIHEDAEGRGDALSPADMDETVRELTSLGANATRAQHPLSPALLERLDAAGIMVWMGIGPVDSPGSWTSKTPALRRQSEGRVRTSLLQLQSHPSVIAWNLANEVAGNGHPGGQAAYISKMAKELKRRDPGRLVALDVWGAHPPKQPGGAMYKDIDAIGDTNYIGWYEDTLGSPASVTAAIRAHVKKMRRVFPGKVLVVTEFGAEANAQNPSAKPGGFRFQAELLARHVTVYRTDPELAGMLVWNLRDFAVSPSFAGGSISRQVPGIQLVRGLNQKGLFFYDGRPKPSAVVVSGALASARAAFAARTNQPAG
jgi:Glycosyl hydrolases family 2, TIM barrel domain/Glycosyl hydrolases family 2